MLWFISFRFVFHHEPSEFNPNALLQPRNVGIQEMEMASELSQKSKKTTFGMIDPRVVKGVDGVSKWVFR